MNKAMMVRFCACGALLGMVAVGCKPASGPATLSSGMPRAERQADRLSARAARAMAKADPARAVQLAEEAVSLSPRDPAHRLLLGRAYIGAGRFVSAEAAFTDVLSLSPDNGQAQISLALARVALGKGEAARTLLTQARGRVGESDRGLALTLAGDKEAGITALEQAARADGADAKARQNYALGLALAGRWAESRTVAAQDLTPAQLRVRMSQWALLSQPAQSWDQVAALLGVMPVRDAGMPVALALGPDASAPALAETGGGQWQAAEADAMPSAPAAIEAERPSTEITSVEMPAVAVPVHRFVEPAAVTPSPLLVARSAPSRQIAAPVRQTMNGRYVVQLGAFSSPGKVETAWRSTAARVGSLARLSPYSAAFTTARGGTMYRLSLAGIETHEAADGLCRRIRAAGSACFVRGSAGDALVNWGGGRQTRLAVR